MRKPIKKGLRTCISPGLIIGGLRYVIVKNEYLNGYRANFENKMERPKF